MKNAIFTVSISNSENRKMYECSLKTIRFYAKKIGADLIVQTHQKISHPQYIPHMEKFNLREILKTYSRVLYIDNDILITPDAPDIFKIYKNKNAVYMFNQAQIKNYNKSLSQIAKKTANNLDFWYKKGHRLSYFNTGVILASRQHKNYFTIEDDYFKYVYEQGYLNYKLMKNKVPIEDLDTKFNRLLKYKSQKGYFLHYITGVKDREKKMVKYYHRLFKKSR